MRGWGSLYPQPRSALGDSKGPPSAREAVAQARAAAASQPSGGGGGGGAAPAAAAAKAPEPEPEEEEVRFARLGSKTTPTPRFPPASHGSICPLYPHYRRRCSPQQTPPAAPALPRSICAPLHTQEDMGFDLFD